MDHNGRECRKQQEPQTSQKQPPRRVNWVDDESDKNDEQEKEEQYVLGIDGGESPLFMMKGKINRKTICQMIDSGSTGIHFLCMEVGEKYIRKARILVARPGAKSFLGREWLKNLQYRIERKLSFSMQ